MSFIITTVSRENTVQVSDTRLTSFRNQSVLSETQRKTLVVLGKKAHFVVGWVGFAADETFRHNTGDWLHETLRNMDAVELTIDEIALRLESLATTGLADLKADDKRLAFVMAGWQDSEPFVATVSNYLKVTNKRSPEQVSKTHHIPSIAEAKIATSTFKGDIQRFRNVTDRDYIVNVAGDFKPKKLEPAFMGLERLLKKRAPASEIGGVCRQIALAASAHSNTIGRNLIGVELNSSGRSTCTFYTENEPMKVLVPPILGSEGSSTEATITIMPDESIRVQAKIARRPE